MIIIAINLPGGPGLNFFNIFGVVTISITIIAISITKFYFLKCNKSVNKKGNKVFDIKGLSCDLDFCLLVKSPNYPSIINGLTWPSNAILFISLFWLKVSSNSLEQLNLEAN